MRGTWSRRLVRTWIARKFMAVLVVVVGPCFLAVANRIAAYCRGRGSIIYV